MADTSKITLKQLKDAMNKAKNYTDNEIAGITGVSKVEPEELDMPKVFFYGTALPTTKDNVNLTMDYVSNTAKFSSFVKLKCQGTSSMSYAKKNFTVAMFSDESRTIKLKKDFKGWGAQSKFCLKANYVDTTHTRNISGARIAYDMVQSRPDSPFKQQLLQCPRNGAVDGFPIKLYFNGEFYGIYTWNIPKDGWMFNMDKSNPNHIVLCAEVNTDGNDRATSCNFRQLWDGSDGNEWSYEFGTPSNTAKDSLNRCIGFVMNATDEEFKANIGQYFDLYSLLDYYCFSYFTAHIDGLAKNMLMATYDGVIWGACLYDMDSIYGVDWNGASFKATNIQCPEQYQEQFSRLWVRIEQCFATELYARYLELRQGALSLGNIIKHVEEIYDVIPDRVFVDEKAKWTGLPATNTNTMTRFRNYMRDRAVYVDAQMLEIGTKAPCTGITLSANSLSFTTTDTQTLTATVQPINTTDIVTWSVSPTGVVTVNNGVVTPVANGNCTITATCGSQSATCTVNVALPTVACTSISLDKTELALGRIEGEAVKLTEQLVATVEPSNTTDPIIWSSDTPSIATVNNGLVTAKANGSAVITATCGSQSATCNVTVSGISGEDIFSTAEYALTEATTFNGTSDYIDTGIKLFDTDKDFTVFIDFSSAQTQNTTATDTNPIPVFHCTLEEAPWPGLSLCNGGTNWNFQSIDVNRKSITNTTRQKYVFTKDAITSIITCYKDNGTSINNSDKDRALTNTLINQNILLGCYQTTNGTKGRFWTGTINKFVVWFKQLTDDEITQLMDISVDEEISGDLVFRVDSTSMNTTDNTLTDNVSGINATLTGNPTVSDNQIVFTANDKFSFDISSLNLTTSDRTLRIKFTPTTLDINLRHVIGLGSSTNSWNEMTSSYVNSQKLLVQHGTNSIGNHTVGSGSAGADVNRLSTVPVTGQEYELVISENINDDVIRWYIDGILIQDGRTTLYDPLYLGNDEGAQRFIGSYSLIEIYNRYCETYRDFTNMANNASRDIFSKAEYALTEATTFNGTSDYIDTGIQLFDTAKDFAVYIDYTPTAGVTQVPEAAVFHCLHEVTPYRGLTLMTTKVNDYYFIGGQVYTSNSYLDKIATTGNHKFIIQFTNGVIQGIKTIDGGDIQDVTLGSIAANGPYAQVNQNILLGCYQDASGNKGRYWNGTINKFAVWFKQLTDDEINEIAGITVSGNLLEGITWSANADNGIYNNASQGTPGAEKGSGNGDAYLSGQIPCSKKKYVLSNINGATFLYKEMYVYASDGTFLGGSYGGGKYNTDGDSDASGGNVTMDLRNIDDEPAYMRITVFPNHIASNNNPATQLKLISLD